MLRIVYLLCADEEAMIHRIKRRAIRENRYDERLKAAYNRARTART